MRGTPEERFNAKFTPEPNSGCWLWTGWIDRMGYGQFWFDSSMNMAHRAAYEIYKGPIPERMHVDHLCSVRHCVNPEHLEAVSQQENNRRTIDRGLWNNGQSVKTHCPAGHPYAGDNLYETPDGRRECRVCRANRYRAYINRLAAKR